MNEKKTFPNPFGDWLKTIPMGSFDEIRNRIIHECKINDQVFRHWKAGNSRVPELAKPIIEEIAGKLIFTDYDSATTDPTETE